jgi:hypothetical protein
VDVPVCLAYTQVYATIKANARTDLSSNHDGRNGDFPSLKLEELSCVTISSGCVLRSEMALRHAFATLAILLGQWQSLAAQAHTAPMLEIHVDTPKWMNGCLDLTVERVNISTQTIYVPEWGRVTFLLSTKLIHDDPSRKDDEFWLPFFGLSDIVTFEADPLAAGSKTTDHFCLPETFAVVNQQRKTRRQVEVRARVKIVASYFPTEQDWRTNKSEQEKHMPTSWRSPSASLEMLLPCLPRSECVDCNASPLITEGEGVVIPDVFQFHKDWNDRGKTLAEALYRTYPACKN